MSIRSRQIGYFTYLHHTHRAMGQYETLATSTTPALTIFLVDISASMSLPMAGRRRIDIVIDALSDCLRQMVYRSTKGRRIQPRYQIALYLYAENVFDVLGGIKSVAEVARLGVPELAPQAVTNTAKGLHYVERLLQQQLPALQNCPAPVVCHMTDGVYSGDDPEPAARRIMDITLPDGKVLFTNVFLTSEDRALQVTDHRSWPGIGDDTEIPRHSYVHKLRRMSSRLPDSYRALMLENGYQLQRDAYMLLPGNAPDIVAMGFQMASATPIHRGN